MWLITCLGLIMWLIRWLTAWCRMAIWYSLLIWTTASRWSTCTLDCKKSNRHKQYLYYPFFKRKIWVLVIECSKTIISNAFYDWTLFISPLKTSPEYTRAGVYGKCMLKQNQIVFTGLNPEPTRIAQNNQNTWICKRPLNQTIFLTPWIGVIFTACSSWLLHSGCVHS